jgi:hypothetical protein
MRYWLCVVAADGLQANRGKGSPGKAKGQEEDRKSDLKRGLTDAFTKFIHKIVALFFDFDHVHDLVNELDAEASLAAPGNEIFQVLRLILVDGKGFTGVFDLDKEGVFLPVNGNFDRGVIVALVLMNDAVGAGLVSSQNDLVGDFARHIQIE